jgi:NAD-dependent SIR2 family protein deacetylase
MDDHLNEAIRIIESSTRIMFLTGAGMSADSGIPTFRDREGFWNRFPVYAALALRPEELATGTGFIQHPEQSWGFYEWRRRNAAQHQPHAGYDAINALMKRYDGFIFTTNTDGYHLRSGASPDKVYEVHGSMWRLQLVSGSTSPVWDNTEVPLCDLDERTMTVKPESMPRSHGSLLRPNILMFDDYWYVSNFEQIRDMAAFEEQPIDTVILVGSDCGVPTNVLRAAAYQKQDAKVICINPSADCCGGFLKPDVHLLVGAQDGLVALATLDQSS